MRRTVFVLPVLILVLGVSWGIPAAARALEVGVPLSTPRLTGLEVDFPVGAATSVLEAVLRYDAKGKVVGEATVDGAATTVKGGIKRKGDVWVYGVGFKGVTEKLSLKITGVIGTGFASIKYAGPKGKANIPEFPIELQASVGSTSGELDVAVQVDPRGKITGTGRFTSGLGNDPPEEGTVKGKVTRTALNIGFKSGKQKLTFKGALDGEYFLGLLKVTSPPAKEKVESFRVPVSAIPLPPPDDDDDSTGHEDALFTISLISNPVGRAEGLIQVNRVTRSSGRQLQRAYINFYTFAGDSFQANLEGIEFPNEPRLPPSQVGPWFELPIYRYEYDVHENRLTREERTGTMHVAVSQVDELAISGTWSFEDMSGRITYEGTWTYLIQPLPPEDPIEQIENAYAFGLLLGGPGSSATASVDIYRTTRRSGVQGWGAAISGTNGETSYNTIANPEVPAIPALPSAPGPWFTLLVAKFDPGSSTPAPYGMVSLVLEQIAGSVHSGSWRLEDQGSTLQSGTWRLDTDPIDSTTTAHTMSLDLAGQGYASGGWLTVYANTRRSGAVAWTGYVVGITADQVPYWTGAGEPVPIPALPAVPGSWFTVPVSGYDEAALAYMPFGSVTFAVGDVSGMPSGSWSVKDLGGTERGAGTWQVNQ